MHATESAYEYSEGDSAVIVSVPHCGTFIPEEVARHMTAVALENQDVDWYVDRLYAFAECKGISIINAKYSRYVIDINRDKSDSSLYPGQFTTSLCPTTTFQGDAIYQSGHEPSTEEIRRRTSRIWQPYHDQLSQLISVAINNHGYAIVLDAHSIASEVPLLFDGKLADLNYGTNDGISCAPSLIAKIEDIPHQQYRTVVNGRFKGGYICRHYGQPNRQQHTIQLELSQATYLNEANREWQQDKAEKLQDYLKLLLEHLLSWQPASTPG